MTPLISVIVPCYNHGAFVGEAVGSVLAQTVQDVEILILDDGSDDPATTALLESPPWPRTMVFRTANQGLARARNFLLARARGEYICALDADDKLHPAYFETTLAAFDRQPGLSFVSTRLQLFGDEERLAPIDLSCDLPTLLTDCPIFSAALVRRSAVEAVGGYDERLNQGNEDWDFWIRLLEANLTGTILPDALFFYRRRRGSMSDTCTRGDTHLDQMAFLIDKHRASFQRHLHRVMSAKESEIVEFGRRVAAVTAEVDQLEATIERRRGELLRLSARRDDQLARRAPLERLRTEYERSLAEIEALRRSASWRVTAPLRKAYELLLRVRHAGTDKR